MRQTRAQLPTNEQVEPISEINSNKLNWSNFSLRLDILKVKFVFLPWRSYKGSAVRNDQSLIWRLQGASASLSTNKLEAKSRKRHPGTAPRVMKIVLLSEKEGVWDMKWQNVKLEHSEWFWMKGASRLAKSHCRVPGEADGHKLILLADESLYVALRSPRAKPTVLIYFLASSYIDLSSFKTSWSPRLCPHVSLSRIVLVQALDHWPILR